MYQMLVDDLLHVIRMNEPIPDRIGIDHNDRAMLTLIEASQLVGADLPLQTGFFYRILES